MKTLNLLLLMSFTTIFNALAQYGDLGFFKYSKDIGNVEIPGSASFDKEKQTYTIEASGVNIWFGEDEFHYLFRKLQGDFILRAQVQFIGKGIDPHRKIGWMVRTDLDPNAKHAIATVHGDGLTSLQYRSQKGEDMKEQRSSLMGADVIQLERRGGQYIMSVAQYGKPLVSNDPIDLNLGDDVYVGLFACSHRDSVKEKAIFSNVRIIKPAPSDLVPYQDYIGSYLEIMDLETGNRKIIHKVNNSIQAPNWTVDGKTLIYNSEGKLYNFDIATGKISELNTGFATSNNNDHVLTFDGKLIGISHHSQEDEGNSVIYYLPVEGGKPKRVTPKSPSYFHGWSPDNQYMVYTGGRDGQYDIYKIKADGSEEEIQLTHKKTLDDGPEYTPDGEWIYFNSARTGTMQIWRMKPDGSQQEQITFDQYNDWFPHISPDGKSLIMISYMPEIDAADHPFYKHVYLRQMPLEGGEPKVIAYIYGGQGTINVPSYSPDGKKIAFVSNSILLD